METFVKVLAETWRRLAARKTTSNAGCGSIFSGRKAHLLSMILSSGWKEHSCRGVLNTSRQKKQNICQKLKHSNALSKDQKILKHLKDFQKKRKENNKFSSAANSSQRPHWHLRVSIPGALGGRGPGSPVMGSAGRLSRRSFVYPCFGGAKPRDPLSQKIHGTSGTSQHFWAEKPTISGFWGMKLMKSHHFGPRWSTNPTIPLISLDAAEVLRKHGGIYEESVGRVSSWVGCQSVDISSSTLVDRRWSTLKISEPKEDCSTNKSCFFRGCFNAPYPSVP